MSNYSKQWSTASPGFLIFLIDQSSSMGKDWSNGKTFASFTAEVINRTINELIATNAAGESVKNRVFISLIGYGGNTVSNIRSGYLSEYADTPLRIDRYTKEVSDGDGGKIEMQIGMPIFIEPSATGITPMADAFQLAEELIKKWIQVKNDNPVPVIINITDGKPDMGKPELTEQTIASTIATAGSIMSMETLDGNPLIFNVHIGKDKQEIHFPTEMTQIGDDAQARFLFQISSRVPEVYKRAAKDLKLGELNPGCKGFISNASPENLIKFINFGSSGGLYRVNF